MIYLDWTLFLEIAFFLFLLFMLRLILFKPLLELVERRRKAVEDRKDAAKKWRTEAEEKLFAYRSKMEKAASEADVLKSSVLREARDKQHEIVMNAQKQSEKIIASQVELAKIKAEEVKKELEQKIGELAQNVVERLVL